MGGGRVYLRYVRRELMLLHSCLASLLLPSRVNCQCMRMKRLKDVPLSLARERLRPIFQRRELKLFVVVQAG